MSDSHSIESGASTHDALVQSLVTSDLEVGLDLSSKGSLVSTLSLHLSRDIYSPACRLPKLDMA
jgi:hypothetical protein